MSVQSTTETWQAQAVVKAPMTAHKKKPSIKKERMAVRATTKDTVRNYCVCKSITSAIFYNIRDVTVEIIVCTS